MYPIIEIGFICISSYRLMFAITIIVGYLLFQRQMINYGLLNSKLKILTIYVFTFLFGFILSKIPLTLLYGVNIIITFDGGYWYYGALGSLLGLIIITEIYSIPLLKTLDVLVPVASLGYGLLKIGCLLTGDFCYGKPTKLPWGIVLNNPDNVFQSNVPLHPVPLYEAILFFILYKFLLILNNKDVKPGTVFCIYVITSSLIRFEMEWLRLNSKIIFGYSETQIMSSLFAFLGSVYLVLLYKQSIKVQL